LDRARDEDYYDKKYWAFLNGYLNLKMSQLLENEVSVIQASIRLYVQHHNLKGPETAKLAENITVGQFIDEIKKKPDTLVAFNMELAREFI